MTQTRITKDSQSPRVNFGAAIEPDDKYSSDEEEEDKSIYMYHQAELENAKPQPDGIDAPPTELLDTEQNGERQVTCNIGEEIRYTKDGQNEKAHILTGTFSN